MIIVMLTRKAMEEFGGYASRQELMAWGCAPEVIEMDLYYRKILRVRRGHYVTSGTPPQIMRALRVGGRLACVSALDFYAGREDSDAPVHVLVPYGSSRLGVDPVGAAVIHWTRRELEGSRTVVSERIARSQAERCARARELRRG